MTGVPASGKLRRVKVVGRGEFDRVTCWLRMSENRADTAKRDSLHYVSRLLCRSEGEEEASAYFGRNDNAMACA